MAVPILLLTVDQPPLVTISPSSTLEEAAALMIEHDFSQLPVVEDGKPYGRPASFVTGNSIVRALRTFGASLRELHVRDAIVTARTISADEDLFSKMDDILDAYAVLILNPDRTIAGIVTNYDTTQYFRRRAEDMLLVEDIETTLKDHVRAAYGGDDASADGALRTAINALGTPVDTIRDGCHKAFRKFCNLRNIPVSDSDVAEYVNKPFESSKVEKRFDDLTLNEYIQLARRPDAWQVLSPTFRLSDSAFLKMLEGVRNTRNKLMHFRPDISAVDRDQLRFCAEWFKNHPSVVIEESVVAEQPSSSTPINGVVRTIPGGEIEYLPETGADSDDPPVETKVVESKYAPLARFLTDQPDNQERVTLSFAEIERIIGASLPAAAGEHRAWWANDEKAHVQSGQWLKVNWRVASINMTMERVTFARARDRERAYIDFFSSVQNDLRKAAGFPLFAANPLGTNWLTLVKYPSGGHRLVLSFALRHRLRLEFYIDTGESGENKRIFDDLLLRRDFIESAMGCPLEWERLEKRRACRIALYTDGSITDEPEQLEKLVDWGVENAIRFHSAIQETV